MRLVSLQLGKIEDAPSLNRAQLDAGSPASLDHHGEQTTITTQGWILLTAGEACVKGSLTVAASNQTQADAGR